MKMQKNKIAQKLMILRQLHQLSQEEVAGRIGVSRQAVAKWETGFPQPKATSSPRFLLPPSSGRNRVYRKTTCLKKSVQKLTLQGSQNGLPGGSFRMVVSVFVQNGCCVFVSLPARIFYRADVSAKYFPPCALPDAGRCVPWCRPGRCCQSQK